MVDEKLLKKINRTYFHIKDRCYNKRSTYYRLYGGDFQKALSNYFYQQAQKELNDDNKK